MNIHKKEKKKQNFLDSGRNNKSLEVFLAKYKVLKHTFLPMSS